MEEKELAMAVARENIQEVDINTSTNLTSSYIYYLIGSMAGLAIAMLIIGGGITVALLYFILKW